MKKDFFFSFLGYLIRDIAIEMWKINAVILEQKKRREVPPTALENDGTHKVYI